MALERLAVVEKLKSTLGADFLGEATTKDEILTVEVLRTSIFEAIRLLKEDAQLNFHFLTTLCGIHFPDKTGAEIGVVYHLHNMYENFRIRVKVFFPKDDSKIPSVTSLFPAANWMERETFDFFGIHFEGHPDLRRILNVDDLPGFPLLKEFRLEDGTRTDKDDRFFGRTGHEGVEFDKRYVK